MKYADAALKWTDAWYASGRDVETRVRRWKRPFDAGLGYPQRAELLIVDDEPDFLELLRMGLDEYTILTAKNGREALAIFKECCPDLIITDIVMPIMTGAQLIDVISQYPKAVPIIAFSGYSLEPDSYEQLVIRENSKGFLNKPFSMEELRQLVQDSISGPSKN